MFEYSSLLQKRYTDQPLKYFRYEFSQILFVCLFWPNEKNRKEKGNLLNALHNKVTLH